MSSETTKNGNVHIMSKSLSLDKLRFLANRFLVLPAAKPVDERRYAFPSWTRRREHGTTDEMLMERKGAGKEKSLGGPRHLFTLIRSSESRAKYFTSRACSVGMHPEDLPLPRYSVGGVVSPPYHLHYSPHMLSKPMKISASRVDFVR